MVEIKGILGSSRINSVTQGYRCLVALFFIVGLVSCDGPNEQIEATTASKGVHNGDGFNLVIKINNGASITPEAKVALKIAADGAKEMYVTQESACNIGGVWESFNSFKQMTLQKENEMNFFYVKVRSASRESDCSFASIEHDSTIPTIQLTSPADGTTVSSPSQWALVGTCSEDVKIVITITGLVFAPIPCIAGMWVSTLDISSLPSGNFALQVKGVDRVLNTSVIHSFGFLK